MAFCADQYFTGAGVMYLPGAAGQQAQSYSLGFLGVAKIHSKEPAGWSADSQTAIFSSTTFIVTAKQNVVWLSLNLPEAYFTCESIFWLPDAFADGGGIKVAS